MTLSIQRPSPEKQDDAAEAPRKDLAVRRPSITT